MRHRARLEHRTTNVFLSSRTQIAAFTGAKAPRGRALGGRFIYPGFIPRLSAHADKSAFILSRSAFMRKMRQNLWQIKGNKSYEFYWIVAEYVPFYKR